jgi:hypothetical protein
MVDGVPVSKVKAIWTDDDDILLAESLLQGVEMAPDAPLDFNKAAMNLETRTTAGGVKTLNSCRSRWNRVRRMSCRGTY